LGAWGALIPFIGPIFNWAYTSDPAWTWTVARGWLEVLPGVVTAAGGLLLLLSANRASAMLGGWLAVFGGAWFVVGRAFASTLGISDVGQPVATGPQPDLHAAVLEVTYFTGLGALIVLLGGAALARVAVRHARDVVVTDPAPVAVPAHAANYDESQTVAQARADHSVAADGEPRRHGLFRRHHHAGV
jgi:hypothetical protein